MAQRSAASTYTQTAIESAPPLKIVHLLYEGAIRFLDQALALDAEEQPHEYKQKLNRAEDIVSELRISLDPGPAPEIAKNLTALYLFVEDKIQEASSTGDGEALLHAREVLETLLSGWKQLELDAAEPLRRSA